MGSIKKQKQKQKPKRVKHEFEWESTYTGECGDHYCPGHYTSTITCKCGWKKTFSDKPDEEKLMLQHRLDVLEGLI